MNRVSLVIVLLFVLVSQPAAAQSHENRFQLGVGLAGAVSGEFDSTDIGVGVRFSWYPTAFVGAEAEVGFYPGEFAAFSGNRVEGLFGMTIGPRIGRLRPFAKLRPGFVTFQEASEPFACIAIFPPPLPCRLAVGKTVFALDLGGGVELFPAGRTSLRVDIGDRLMRYPGTVLDRNFMAREDAFFSHDFRFAIGAGLRF
jgi:hypothetical protein